MGQGIKTIIKSLFKIAPHINFLELHGIAREQAKRKIVCSGCMQDMKKIGLVDGMQDTSSVIHHVD